MFAIAFGVGLSPLVLGAVPHGTPWWDQCGSLVTTIAVTGVLLTALLIYAFVIAHEAGKMETQWHWWFLDLIERNPRVLKFAVLDGKPGDWPVL